MLNKKLLFLILILEVYYVLFIFRLSEPVDGQRYFVPADDVFITMTYARTYARTGELAWYPGASRVEGFSSPLWLLLLTDLQLIPVPPARSGAIVQLLGMVILVATLMLIYGLMLDVAGDETLALSAVLVVGTCFPFVFMALDGWEYALIGLVTVALVRTALSSARWPPTADLLLAIGLATRMDFLVTVVPLGAFLVYKRKVHWLRPLLIVLLVLGGLTLWRWRYYGALLPNAWTLKMTGYPILLRLTRGAWATLRDVWRWNPLFLAVPFVSLLGKGQRRGEYGLPTAIFAAQAAYTVWVGGDAWHEEYWGSRFLISTLPIFVPVMLARLSTALEGVAQSYGIGKPRNPTCIMAAAVLLALFLSPIDRMLLIHSPRLKSQVESIKLARFIRENTARHAIIGVASAGLVPYFSERRSIDFLGRTDRVVAKTAAHRAPPGLNPMTYFYPGHLKWSAGYSIGIRRPDVVTAVWGDPEEWYRELMKHDYLQVRGPPMQVWIRRDRRDITARRVSRH